MLAWIRRLVRGPEKPDVSESEAALQWSRTAREAAEARGDLVTELAAPFRRARQENHLSERIELLFTARRGAQQ
jgi:hypothetical protein